MTSQFSLTGFSDGGAMKYTKEAIYMNNSHKAAAAATTATVTSLIPGWICFQSGKEPFRKQIYKRIPFLKGNQNKYDLLCAGLNQNSPLSCRNIIFPGSFVTYGAASLVFLLRMTSMKETTVRR